jgi:hypothetical protein
VAALTDATEAELIEDLSANRAQLWPGERAALVTRLISGPPRVHVWLGGGDLSELLSLAPGVMAWGRQQGAEFATVGGRSGWARLFKSIGGERRGDEVWKVL